MVINNNWKFPKETSMSISTVLLVNLPWFLWLLLVRVLYMQPRLLLPLALPTNQIWRFLLLPSRVLNITQKRQYKRRFGLCEHSLWGKSWSEDSDYPHSHSQLHCRKTENVEKNLTPEFFNSASSQMVHVSSRNSDDGAGSSMYYFDLDD